MLSCVNTVVFVSYYYVPSKNTCQRTVLVHAHIFICHVYAFLGSQIMSDRTIVSLLGT